MASWWKWVALSVVATASCESDNQPSAATSGGTGGGGVALPEPEVHRATAAACTGMPPPGNAFMGSGGCMQDSECTDGINGRCIWPFGGDNLCTYDECATDAECGVGVCACRVPASFGVNRCFQGNCVVDDDCGAKGWCSPSAVDVFPNCMTGLSPGSIGFFCHTAADECNDDADCAELDGTCIYNVEAGHWACFALLCTN